MSDFKRLVIPSLHRAAGHLIVAVSVLNQLAELTAAEIPSEEQATHGALKEVVGARDFLLELQVAVANALLDEDNNV